MSIDQKLLSLLVCPITKTAVTLLDSQRLHTLNQAITEHTVVTMGGTTIDATIQEALITIDGKTIYRIDDRIPVMLEEEAIAASWLTDK